jgi:hypothetical protein
MKKTIVTIACNLGHASSQVICEVQNASESLAPFRIDWAVRLRALPAKITQSIQPETESKYFLFRLKK